MKCQFRTYQVRTKNVIGRLSRTDRNNVAIKWLENGELQSYATYIRTEINYNVGIKEGSPY